MILSVCPNPSIDAYAWLQSFENGMANRIVKLKEYPGGKGIHVAMALKELGSSVAIMGNWAGYSGEWIKNASQLNEIDKLGPQLMGNNRKCYTFRSSQRDTFDNSELLEPGPVMSNVSWNRFLLEFKIIIKKFHFVSFSGSWPEGAPDDAYSQLLKICKDENIRSFLDCSGIQLKNALQEGFFGLHINEHEANSVFGTQNHIEIRELLMDKISLIAITKGKEGLFLHSKDHSVHANVSINDVKSTVGSGDCLTAGIVHAIDNGFSFNRIATYGVACGAANCLNEELGILKVADVNKLLNEVELKNF